MTQNNRQVGGFYERQAAAFLEKRGYQILEYNYRCRRGEIDLIARDGLYLVFIEVKYRKSGDTGTALDAIGPKKAVRVRRVAEFYLYAHGYPEETACRFDAACIDGGTITYLENAF